MMPNNIRYLYDADTGIELIFCDNSTISYPLHNHVSVFTIGMVLDGSILLTTNQGAKVYDKNQTFVILPYVPHSISTHDSYTLLSLCIDKSLIYKCAIDTVKNNIIHLVGDALDGNRIIHLSTDLKNSWNYVRKRSLVSMKWHKTLLSANITLLGVLSRK